MSGCGHGEFGAGVVHAHTEGQEAATHLLGCRKRAMTGRRSQSLGRHTYERLFRGAGLTCVADAVDEGENHNYFVEKVW